MAAILILKVAGSKGLFRYAIGARLHNVRQLM